MSREQSAQSDADNLFRLMRRCWRDEWRVRDYCLALTRNFDGGYLREVAAQINISHRTIQSHAKVAAHYPPEDRMPEVSVRTHVKWMHADEEDGK